MHLQDFLSGENRSKPASDSHGPSTPRMQDGGTPAGRDTASSHGPATTGGLNEITVALLFQAEMPGNPWGAEEGQGGMQLLSQGEGRSLLGAGKARGDGTPLPTGGEMLCVKRQGEKLLIPPARDPCLDTSLSPGGCQRELLLL